MRWERERKMESVCMTGGERNDGRESNVGKGEKRGEDRRIKRMKRVYWCKGETGEEIRREREEREESKGGMESEEKRRV